MDTSTRRSSRSAALVGALLALVLLLGTGTPGWAAEDTSPTSVVLAAEERERRPIATTQRDQLGLVLYVLMVVAVVAGGATLRRQLRGERPQSDGEFRWR